MNACQDIALEKPYASRMYDVDTNKWQTVNVDRVRINVRSDDPAKGLATKVKIGPYWVYVCPLKEGE